MARTADPMAWSAVEYADPALAALEAGHERFVSRLEEIIKIYTILSE